METMNYAPSGGKSGHWRIWPTAMRMVTSTAILSAWLVSLESKAQILPYTEDFNSGTAVGWYVLDTLGVALPPAYPPFYSEPQVGSVTFPGGNTYRLEHMAIPHSALYTTVYMARMSSWALGTYTTNHFQMAVDVVAFEDNVFKQDIGLNAHASNIGPGTSVGYRFHYLSAGALPGGSDGFAIERVYLEAGTSWMSGDYSGPYPDEHWYPGCVASKPYHMDPTKQYRMVFLGSGLHFEGRVYALPDLTKPVLVTMCNFSSAAGGPYEYTNGLAGLSVQNLYGLSQAGEANIGFGPVDATFDNFSVSETYSAHAGTPAVPSLSVTTVNGTNFVNWPGEVLGLWAMEQTWSMAADAVWTDVPLWQIEYDRTSGLRRHVATNSPMGFYRLRKL